ncbi:eukaryotic translation initiation factor 3 subunit L [Anopheles albimanus]|uniref:Eukaryotic translation initiation factor 3 subunit L n=1 Tax=Anopheles albimanus TaxID=7167 RepID=A0A182FGM7_ANOAL|nr:eukaryotic translation initiation factor 3 subunit L [Anopheles albimanus]
MYSNEEAWEGGYDEYGYEMGMPDDQIYEHGYYPMHEDVKKFLIYFASVIKDGVVYEIQNLYENTFPKLSEQHFEKKAWPSEAEVAHLVDNDSLFLILYKELYYRHLHARIQGGPSLEQRLNSFFNYCNFFNYILPSKEPVQLELPDIWLWELIDEFVYQFQNFAQYRARLTDKTEDEMDTLLNNNSKVWNILCILNVLHSLVSMSKIKDQLEAAAAGKDPEAVAGEFGRHSFYKMLGYFSLVGLLRVHSLLGDYHQAIKVLEPIEIHKKSQYSHIPACQISTSYYVGFAYMMMRRYSDAIRTFSSILLYIQRTKQLYSGRSYQNDQINKQTDQMYHLLAICLVLHPQCIDESIQQVLREKNYHDNMYKMQCGDLDVFRNFFVFACPKFVSPVPPPPDAPIDDYVKEALEHQINVFMDEVRQQQELPTIRSYLKLYTTLPMMKLASFMDHLPRDEVDKQKLENLLTRLLCFKHKMKNVVWTKGSSGLEGKFQSGSELDFYIDKDMIHIADTKVSHRYGDFFIRKILKFEDLNRRLHAIKG